MSETEVTKLSRQIEEIKTILYNDALTGRAGLVQKVDEMQEELDTYINQKNTEEAVRKGQMYVYGLLGAGCVWVLTVVAKLIWPALIKFI